MRTVLASASSVWAFTGADTPMLKAAVRKDVKKAMKVSETSAGTGEGPLRAPECDWQFLVAAADRAPSVCATAMKEAKAAAVLVPTDLIGDIAIEVRRRMTEATFVGSAPFCESSQVAPKWSARSWRPG